MFFRSLGTLADFVLTEVWPVDFFAPPSLPEFLNGLFVTDVRETFDERGRVYELGLGCAALPRLSIPGLDSVTLTLEAGPTTYDEAAVDLTLPPDEVPEPGDPDPEPDPYGFQGLTFFRVQLIL